MAQPRAWPPADHQRRRDTRRDAACCDAVFAHGKLDVKPNRRYPDDFGFVPCALLAAFVRIRVWHPCANLPCTSREPQNFDRIGCSGARGSVKGRQRCGHYEILQVQVHTHFVLQTAQPNSATRAQSCSSALSGWLKGQQAATCRRGQQAAGSTLQLPVEDLLALCQHLITAAVQGGFRACNVATGYQTSRFQIAW